VQQWNAIIALNYPARKFGLKRGISVEEARRTCPDLVLQHVPTWREGDSTWAYRPDVLQFLRTDKSALDPYRLASRQTIECVKKELPPLPIQQLERASVDEMFLDLTSQVHGILLQRYYDQLASHNNDPDAYLPLPSCDLVNWDPVFGHGSEETNSNPNAFDWDDMALLLGSEIVQGLRDAILQQLKYTCSAGIAPNKALAKLAAGHRKPNQQTVILNRAIPEFLACHKFTDIRGLGRDLGLKTTRAFQTDQVTGLLRITLAQMQSTLGIEDGTWVYNIIRGIDHSEVIRRSTVQSMLSAKTFVPKITVDQARKWLVIFVKDLLNRLADEQSEDHRIHPSVLTLVHQIEGRFGLARSKQATLRRGHPLDEEYLLSIAETLLSQFATEAAAWPCRTLSLRLSGFQGDSKSDQLISSFFSAKVQPEAPIAPKGRSAEPIGASLPGLYTCPHCDKAIPEIEVLEHLDWHIAMDLSA
jgi:DNA polymerase eta